MSDGDDPLIGEDGPLPHDWFTREAVTGLCPACGAGWTGSPCSTCHYEAPVPVDFQARPFEPSPAPRDEAREPNGCPCTVIEPCGYACSCANPVMSGGCLRCCRYGSAEQRRAAAENIAAVLAAAPRADPTQTQVNAAADVLRFHEHWNMLPLDAEAWIVARKMLDAARLPESKQSDDWQTIKAECDSWWIAAIADEAPFVVTRIRRRVEACAAARAPGTNT